MFCNANICTLAVYYVNINVIIYNVYKYNFFSVIEIELCWILDGYLLKRVGDEFDKMRRSCIVIESLHLYKVLYFHIVTWAQDTEQFIDTSLYYMLSSSATLGLLLHTMRYCTGTEYLH